MGLLSFVKNAGAKVFGIGDTNEEKAQKIVAHLNSFELDTSMLNVTVEDETVKLAGSAKTIFDKIRVVATSGNVEGMTAVNDDALTVGEAVDVNLEDTTEKKDNYYTVVSGDNLSKISKAMYGDANKYNHIFEANRPMLSHPDKIYPGQVLAIPTLA